MIALETVSQKLGDFTTLLKQGVNESVADHHASN